MGLSDDDRAKLYRLAIRRMWPQRIPFNLKSWICCAGRCTNAGRCHHSRICAAIMLDPEYDMFQELDIDGITKMERWR